MKGQHPLRAPHFFFTSTTIISNYKPPSSLGTCMYLSPPDFPLKTKMPSLQKPFPISHSILHPPILALNDTPLNSYSVSSYDHLKIGPVRGLLAGSKVCKSPLFSLFGFPAQYFDQDAFIRSLLHVYEIGCPWENKWMENLSVLSPLTHS